MQKTIVEEKNKEITDSINYAKLIQDAIFESQNGDDLPPLDLTLYHELDFKNTTKEELVKMGLQKEYKEWLARQ